MFISPTIKKLLENRADPFPFFKTIPPLKKLLESGYNPPIKKLLENRADLFFHTKDMTTAIHASYTKDMITAKHASMNASCSFCHNAGTKTTHNNAETARDWTHAEQVQAKEG